MRISARICDERDPYRDEPMMIAPLISSVCTGTRQTSFELCASVRGTWTKAIRLAGLPGMGWLIGSLLAGSAVAVAVVEGDGKEQDSIVGAVLAVPFRSHYGGGCYLGWQSNLLMAHRDRLGAWTIAVPARDTGEWMEHAPDTVTFIINRPSTSSGGVWSPILTVKEGRTLRVFGLAPDLTDVDLKGARAAVVEAWPALTNPAGAYLARTPLEPFESEAIKAGTTGYACSVRWGFLANDALVLVGVTLLIASHPLRLARWRAARGPRPELVSCPGCRYALAGLPVSAAGDRTCPECGRVCGQFF